MWRPRATVILYSALSIFGTACATKGFVRDQVRATEARLGDQFESQDTKLRESAEQAAVSRQEIDATDQRLQQELNAADQRLQDLDARVIELDTAATEAQSRADQAAGVARDVEAKLSQRIADRNKYRLLESRFVYFESDRADLRDAGIGELEEVAKALQVDPNAVVELQGFADPRGSDQYNDELARKRVEVVIRHLVQRHGVDLRQIRSIAMGKMALAPGEKPSREALANARRVEMRLLAPWSSWEDTQAGIDENAPSPAASPMTIEPAKDHAAPPTDQDGRDQADRRDHAEFNPDDASAVLRVLRDRRGPLPDSLTNP